MKRSICLFLAIAFLGLGFQVPRAVAQAASSASQPDLAANGITTPKEHFGFNIGDDYCLANYKQLERYWKKLASGIL